MPNKALNQAIKRNADRFPEDFVFQLTAEEKSEVVTNCDHLPRLKFSRTLLPACSLIPTLCLAAPDAAKPNTLTESEKGYLAQHGDHGSISFRNSKVRQI